MPEPHGTGPGVITPDGCAVELYARLPAWREPGVVHAADTDGGLLWTQSFTARRLDEEMLRRLLGSADLAFGGY